MSAITGSFVVAFSILLLPPPNLGCGVATTGVLLGSGVLTVPGASVDLAVNVLACLLDGFLSGCSFLFEVLVLDD